MQINSYLLNKLNFKARNINFRSDILKIGGLYAVFCP